jgi:hypothetical protein
MTSQNITPPAPPFLSQEGANPDGPAEKLEGEND